MSQTLRADPISIRESLNTPWGETPEVYINSYRKVLDHGHVRLVNSCGNDLSIVRAARVSYDGDWRTGKDGGSDARLIKYLLRNGHTSPFEHVTFTFDVKAPIFVLRQWMRHRTWSYNEISGRYTELPDEFYVPEPHLIGTQSKDNKQVREIEPLSSSNHNTTWEQDISSWIWSQCVYTFDVYKALLKSGCPRELARGVLPLNTYSHMFATVDLHNLFHFLRLRLHEHAQYEIRVYAEAILDIIKPIVPVSVEAFLENNNNVH